MLALATPSIVLSWRMQIKMQSHKLLSLHACCNDEESVGKAMIDDSIGHPLFDHGIAHP